MIFTLFETNMRQSWDFFIEMFFILEMCMKGCKSMKKQMWQDMMKAIENHYREKQHGLIWQEDKVPTMKSIQFIDTIKSKRLVLKQKERYLNQFIAGSWQIQEMIRHDQNLYIVWANQLNKRGWRLTLTEEHTISSIQEYELI